MIPVLAAPLCPMAASLTNGLGPYDGMAASSQYFLSFSVPFLLGRSFLATPDGSRLLARSFIIGALSYIIPCLIEIRLSPQIHYWFYGTSFYGGMRLGGYRPAVFMKTGLQLGIWMSCCAFVALCCFMDPSRQPARRLLDAKSFWAIFIVNILCRSTGAIVILAAGIAAMLPVHLKRSRLGLIALLLICPLYMVTRLTGVWDGRGLVTFSGVIDKSRASSLETRLDNEDELMAKAKQRPLFGWGGWGRSRIYDDRGNNKSLVDGRWIGFLGEVGVIGLFCEFWTLLLPLLVTIIRWRTVWNCPYNAAAIISISGACSFWAINFLSNNQPNPFYWLCAGAISGVGTFSPTHSGSAGDPPVVKATRVRRSLKFSRHEVSSSQPPSSTVK